MRIRRRVNKAVDEAFGVDRPAKNQSKKNMYIFSIVIITALLIVWVYIMGLKAERTVKVVMLDQNIYKNQVIDEGMLKPYDMLQGEFEKYAVVNTGGKKARRIILWEERGEIINSFAAYPLQKDSYAEYRSFIKSRVDNSDTVLYSFPGKEIVPLEIATGELQAFKTFLQPGDRLNIKAIFSQRETVEEDDGYGGSSRRQLDIIRTENVFTDIMIADLLNQRGDSILDIYESYRDRTVYEQAILDSSQSFKDSTEPRTLLVALTPEELDKYYYYLSKSQVKFKASMPQRMD